MPALLEVRTLWKSFGGVHAVRDCSFDVEAGRITGLIGPNGAGKSTAIDLISGFLEPDAGVIRFAGLDVQGRPAHRVARLGLVRTFQSPRVWAGLTVMENMLLAAPEEGREEVWRAVCTHARLRESEEADRAAGYLSGGQKRLLEIARFFQARPRMVLMDEPLTGVNPVLGARIGEGIKHLVAAGMTVLMVEHNLPFVERVCGTVIVMALGRSIAHGPLAALRSDPAVIDAYLGQVPARV
ncbi:MAG: ABC transporter ATP-binding protein [Bacillati bacterium ANGP1]|uniref:ABC transporter ATP-binding protein n=1 Tax=Candidatus Segetimicrobium genomatis TaxID=2569760 RepID=A0A537J530_9BACT|nr:MAG: ABC transporter ATP-binding protein [Terrabacteria group bacterium ANGP1]